MFQIASLDNQLARDFNAYGLICFRVHTGERKASGGHQPTTNLKFD